MVAIGKSDAVWNFAAWICLLQVLGCISSLDLFLKIEFSSLGINLKFVLGTEKGCAGVRKQLLMRYCHQQPRTKNVVSFHEKVG